MDIIPRILKDGWIWNRNFILLEKVCLPKGSELNYMALVHVILACEQNNLIDILLCALTGEEMG